MSDEPVQILAFLNTFAEPERLEVVVDWTNEWPAADPFAGAHFRLASTPSPTQPPKDLYKVELSRWLIPEVREQLAVVGRDAQDTSQQIKNVAELAPKTVADVAYKITGSALTTPAKQARSMKEFLENRPHLFKAANLLPDLQSWVNSQPPAVRAARAAGQKNMLEFCFMGIRPVDPYVDDKEVKHRIEALKSIIHDVNERGVLPKFDLGSVMTSVKRFRELIKAANDAEVSLEGLIAVCSDITIQENNGLIQALNAVIDAVNPQIERGQARLDSVLKNRASFHSFIAAAQEARVPLDNLEHQIRMRAAAEHLLYAESLRRHQIYSRIRGEMQPNVAQAMTAAGNDDQLRRDRRADVRRLARDEPAVGAMFHVLHWFALPSDVDPKDWVGHYIWVLPFDDRGPLNGFLPRPTRVDIGDSGKPVTILRRDNLATYFALAVNVRQIAPALLLDDSVAPKEAGGDPGKPRDVGTRLLHMAATGQTSPQFSQDIVAKHGGVAAWTLHEIADPPPNDGTARLRIDADPQRELADAAESLRRTAPPYDVIGITWDRTTVDSVLDGTQDYQYHTGFKGYRLDVREVSGKERWHSLCTVEREIFDYNQQAVLRSRVPRESYVLQPLQNHSADKNQKPTVLTLPADFVYWAGGSVVVAAQFDRLGESLAPPDTDGSLLVLRELGTTRINPRYGRRYEFRVRGVGLSGIGPDAAFTAPGAARDEVEFRRGVPIEAPAVAVCYIGLVQFDADGKPGKLPAGNCQPSAPDTPRTPDVPLLGLTRDARLELETSLPLAHWRVALHARGLTAAEQAVAGSSEFHRACARLIARARENWRRRLAGMSDAEALRPSAHLSCVDPHCGAIEVVTRAWYPFSVDRDQQQDRHIVVGRAVHKRHDIRCASFQELVVRGEAIIDPPEDDHRRGSDREGMDDRFTVGLDDATLPAGGTPDAAPRMLAGFHCIAEVSARWSEEAITHSHSHFSDEEGRRRWTRHLFAGLERGRPIGGTIKPLDLSFAAGNQSRIAWPVFVDAVYAAMSDLENERNLIQKLPPPPAGQTCETSDPPPAHARPVQWRKIFFDQDCSDQPASPACKDKRTIYRRFVAQQFGESVETTEFPPKHHCNQLAVRLTPRLIPQDQDPDLRKRGLVLPVFTFPNAVTYDPPEKPTNNRDSAFVVATIGEFGAAGVAEIEVTSAGSGYQSPEVVVEDRDGCGHGVRATADPINGGITKINVDVDDRGRDFEKLDSLVVQIKDEKGTGATAKVKALGGSVQRRLPWVDFDVIWTVRVAWRVPLTGGLIERPLELAAVREFQLFRKDLRPKRNPCDPPEGEKPLATLARPGVDTLHDLDLDLVEFTWVDAVTDREPHEYEYRVVAVPEDRHTFAPQAWYTLHVDIPDSQIAARPESARFLPMLAQKTDAGTAREKTDAGTIRSLAIYFSDPVVRSSVDHVTYRLARAADDPMLPIQPKAAVDPSQVLPPFFQPTQWEELFPAPRVPIVRVDTFDTLRQLRGDRDGIVALMKDCKAPDEPADDRRSRLFVASGYAEGRPLIAPQDKQELGNPFFKLQLQIFEDRRFPALAHTAASEPAESDWLQFYPDDLEWASDPNLLKITYPWSQGQVDDKNLVWYRYHFFAAATETALFHVSTFYSRAPALDLDPTRRKAIFDSYKRFAGQSPALLHLFVRVEEGLLAATYKIKEDQVLKADDDPAFRFVVLRSTPKLKDLDVSPP